jgi:8-oxo-dGTP pyrophosphatase MutT (NUDIX family)/phosphohistidine phosphatase SixA
MPEPVRAAGAVLWRPAAGGIEVCVVHRPAYDDWSLPKGKLDDDEHPLVAARREVLEETGVEATPEMRLADVEYVLPTGEPKTVEFWSMRAGDRAAVPIADPTEVDDLAWLTPDEAAQRLSYAADGDLVATVAALPPITAQTLLIRHAHAGERRKWAGLDALRPIDALGQQQAAGLVDVLIPFGPRRLFAATPLRCKQTFEPLAAALQMPIVIDSAFAEPTEAEEVGGKAELAATRLSELRDGPRAAICSQGKLMPPMLALLDGASDPAPYRTPKGGGWIVSWSGEKLVALSPL